MDGTKSPSGEPADDAELRRVHLEQQRIDHDFEIRSKEIELRRLELEAKLSEERYGRRITLSPAVWAAVLTALVGLFGTLIAGILDNIKTQTLEEYRLESNLKLERERFSSTLVLNALEAKDTAEAAKYLLFLVDTGLLPDEEGKIRQVANSPDALPILIPLEERVAILEIRQRVLECQAAGKSFDFGSLTCGSSQPRD